MKRLLASLLLLALMTGCAADPCTRVNERARRLGSDLLRDPGLLDRAVNSSSAGVDAAELQSLAADAIRYNCFAR